MRTFPRRQQSAEARVAESLLFGFIALLVQRQGFVIDKTTRPSETSQMAKLLAVGHGLEFVALHSEHPHLPLPSTVASMYIRFLFAYCQRPKPHTPSPPQPLHSLLSPTRPERKSQL